jgi:hypothetical protein
MDPLTLSILASLGTSYLANLTTPTIQSFFSEAFRQKPELEARVLALPSGTATDVEALFKDAVGVIDAAAGTGTITVDCGVLEAVRAVRFDHQQGTVLLDGSWVQAPVLQTGGTGTGQTSVINTTMRSAGTAMRVTGDAKITITGNAKITQT